MEKLKPFSSLIGFKGVYYIQKKLRLQKRRCSHIKEIIQILSKEKIRKIKLFNPELVKKVFIQKKNLQKI